MLQNCRRCKQPYASRSGLVMCNNCLSRENHLYESYYFRLLRDIDSIAIESVAHKTRLHGDRLVEALHVRMGTSSKYRQLSYWKPGMCYVCRNSQNNPESKEPICLDCLEVFFKTLNGQPISLPEKSTVAPSALSTALNPSAEGPSEITQLKQTITQLQHELNRYKQAFGELPSVSPGTQRLQEAFDDSNSPLMGPNTEHMEDILALIEQNDEEAKQTTHDWLALEMDLPLNEFIALQSAKSRSFHRPQ